MLTQANKNEIPSIEGKSIIVVGTGAGAGVGMGAGVGAGAGAGAGVFMRKGAAGGSSSKLSRKNLFHFLIVSNPSAPLTVTTL